MKRRRFAYICADPGIPLPGTKGASIHVAAVCRELARSGLDGEVHAARPESTRLEGLPLLRIALPARDPGETPGEREEALFLAGVTEDIESDREIDFVYERYSLWHGGGLGLARAHGVPFVLEVNSPLPEEAGRFRDLANAALAEEIATLLLSTADGIVCVSEEIARWVEGRRGRADGIWVVPNGVDAELFAPLPGPRPAPLPPDAPLVAFAGNFRPWHGLDELLAAFEILVAGPVPAAHLLLVGDGPEREEIERAAAHGGFSERVTITGRVPHIEVPRWLGGADVAVAPYPLLDHFWYSPLKLYEYLALGLPVVASDIGQVRAALGGGEHGRLVPPGDPAALAEAIAGLLADRDGARALGARGRAFALEHATWRHRVAEILAWIQELP